MKIKSMSVCAKCSDMFSATFRDENRKMVGDYEGYVPDFFPCEHYGDYVMLDINLETGVITNWRKPTEAELKKLMKKD